MDFDEEAVVVVLFPEGAGPVVGVGWADMGEIGVVGSDGAKENCVSRVGRVMLV